VPLPKKVSPSLGDNEQPCDDCGRVMLRGSLHIDDSEGEGKYRYLCPSCSGK